MYSIGYCKVKAAAKKLSKLNPIVKLDAIPASVMSNNVYEFLQGIGVILDGLAALRRNI
jgi:molybdopterin/thiamine biosynthesis adenylyltransferase